MIPRLSEKHHNLDNSFLTPMEKSFRSILMRTILEKVLYVAKSDMPVILIGEIGAGKKRIAQIIHENSDRAAAPFHSFFCLDLTTDQYEEAFREQLHLSDDHFVLKYDVIEKASRGILYMNQFSELQPELMLNIIKAFLKGSSQLFRFSEEARPRLILSINLEAYADLIRVQEWQTILHLLNPYTIMIPPLRERKEDIPLLINDFLGNIRSKSSRYRKLSISQNALEACSSYNWPGNICQLHNALLQGAVLSHGKTIESHHFPFSMNWKLPYEFEGNN